MEKKDRLNLNPEAEEINAQEENTASVTDAMNVEQPNLPEENQDVLVNNESEEEVKAVGTSEVESIEETVVATEEPEATAEVEPNEEIAVEETAIVVEEAEPAKVVEEVEAKESIVTPEVAAEVDTPVVVAQEEVKADANLHELIHQELISMDLDAVVEEEEEEEEVEDDSSLNYESLSREQLVELSHLVLGLLDFGLLYFWRLVPTTSPNRR